MEKPDRTPTPTPSAESLPLTRSQLLLYLGQQLAPAIPLYNMALAFRISGPLDVGRFQRAFQACIDRCDALRTVVTGTAGGARQTVLPLFAHEVEVIDLSAEADPRRTARAWALERCRRPFVLSEPMFDSVLLRTGEKEFVWFLNQHHLITDAWATTLLYRLTGDFYRRLGEGEPVDDFSAPPPFRSYIEFERTERVSAGRESVDAFWKARRAAAPEPPRLYGNAAFHESTRTERIQRDLGDARSTRLREVAMEPGIRGLTLHLSLFNIFTTLLFAWMHRASGRKRLALGTPAHNRLTSEFKETVGVFIELFPLQLEIDEDETFRSLFEKVRAETGEFLRHAQPGASDPDYNRCFNVVLNYINASFTDFAGMPMQSEWVHPGHGDVGHHLRLQVHDFDATGNIVLHFDFSCALFGEKEREAAAGHFLTLLDALLEDREQTIASVNLLDEEEQRKLLDEFNAPAPAPVPEETVLELFHRQVAEFPGRTALKFRDETLSYAELDERANAVATALAERGTKADDPVGICMRRSPQMVSGVLGILKAGAAYVPLDPGNPAARLCAMADDAGMKTVLTSTCSAERVPEFSTGIETLTIDELPGRAERTHAAVPLDGLAYLLYTSGSTGAPKGVPITHRGLVDYVTWANRQYVRGDQLAFPLFTSLAFDLTVTSLFLPLISGGTLVIYEETGDIADASLTDVIGENAVDFIKLTPSHLRLVSRMELPSQSKITRMVVGGEDFKTSLARSIHEKFRGNIEIYNEYGPTEAVVGCMIHRFDFEHDTGTSVPIGRPADHVQIYVLDAGLRPVPVGVPGELCISRNGLTAGYHGNEALTAERFVAHPFRPGERLYRTGDLARFHSPRSIEFLGRIDRQLKVAGFRIEAAEIEAALESYPNIEGAVVTLREGAGAEASTGMKSVVHCNRCGIPSDYPDIRFNEEGVCHICSEYESYKDAARAWFKPFADLEAIFEESRRARNAEFDCMALLSGGKDSTYALYRLVQMGLRVYAFSFDNGYISEEAKGNIRRVVKALGVRHEFATTPAMPDIFRDSLMRFSNVCNGCFKTIYTLSMTRARELGIPIVVTGLSRGQFFETRLTPEIFRGNRFSPAQVDAAVLAARKTYHRLDDAVSRSLDVGAFRDDTIFDEVRIVDFYRYCDVAVSEVIEALTTKLPWIRPSDTGRSTNCLINDVGIHIHKKERGYHNYALPYSWDVRMGHKTREEAMEELDDEIDIVAVRRMLAEVGYDENRMASTGAGEVFTGYYKAAAEIPYAELREHMREKVPSQVIPSVFVRLDEIPLTRNGKVDYAALPEPRETRDDAGPAAGAAPEGAVEERIAAIWSEVLKSDVQDVERTFFEYGGASLPAMEVMLILCRSFDLQLPLHAIFQAPTIRQLAALVEKEIVAEIESLSDIEASQIVEGERGM